jgi:hypothetical protein
LSKLLAKQYYLDQIKKDNAPHRKIANRMAGKFDVSPALIKNELLEEGYIRISKVVLIKNDQKRNFFFELTGKKLGEPKEIKFKTSNNWEDGTPKSSGNAFDLSTAKGLFNKSELAASQNKGKPHNYNTPVQVIAYSRA